MRQRVRGATILVVAIARARAQKERWEQLMAQFEALNAAIDGLSTSVDNLTERLESVQVEDPATQAAIDEAVARITEVQGRIDSIAAAGGGSTPEVSQPIADTGPQVEHRQK